MLILFLAPPLRAQGPEGWLVPFACAFGPDIAGFNAAFRTSGIPEAGLRHYGWGVELRSGVGGDFLLGPLFFRTTDDVENPAFALRTEHTGIFAEAGIKLPVFKFLTFVPLLGLGGVQPTFHIRRRTEEVPFDSLLAAPGISAHLSPGMKLCGLGALELVISVPSQAGSYGLALRGGYLYSPFTLDWRLANGARVTGTPKGKIQGPWVSVGITLVPAPETEESE